MLAPFRGVRYAEARVSGLAEVTSPPYDVIAVDRERQLMAADPHNVVRLIMPHPAGAPGQVYRAAGRALAAWQDEGILVPDPEPALYVYEQVQLPGNGSPAAGQWQAAAAADLPRPAGAADAAGAAETTGAADAAGAAGPAGAAETTGAGSLQRGLIGALRLVPLDAGIVLPHEDVAPGPVAGRRALMEATQANLEPILLMYDGDSGPGTAARIIEQVATGREPLLQARTSDGLRHRLWAVTDAAELAAIAADLAPRQALIADGHHRYAAYLDLRDRLHRAGHGPGPWDLGLALVVDSAAYPPRIGPIHRVVPDLAPVEAARLAGTAFRVRELPGGAAGLPAALRALAAAGTAGPAFLLAGQDAAWLLTDPDPELTAAAMPPGHSASWRALPASVLEELLITRIWGITDGERGVRVVHDDAASALREADAVPGGTAVICCPPSTADVYAVAASGEKMPRKSTSFWPKPRTGLVLRTFAQG
jgi:uncharacterized protein (DUF1015 family)